MTSYVLQGGRYTRTYSSAALQAYSVKLIASQQSYFKVDGVAFILLSSAGYLLVLQVGGSGTRPGRVLFENYTFGWHP